MYSIFMQLLQAKGESAYSVAKATGVSQSSLSAWKRGISTPNSNTMQKIADYLGVTVDYLMTGEEKEGEKYYLNEETARIAQKVFDSPELRSLFDVASDIPPDQLQAHIDFIKKLKEREKGN